MNEKLYVSNGAVELKGKDYFRDLERDDYALCIDEVVDGLLVTREDMDNIYLSVSSEDEEMPYEDVEDLK